MKKNLFFMTAIVLIATVVSCSVEIDEDLHVSNPEIKTEKFIWERQLDYVMEHNTISNFPLKLLGYKCLGVIANNSNAQKYLDNVFSENSLFAVKSDREAEGFEIMQRQDLIELSAKDGIQLERTFVNHRESMLDCIEIGKTLVIELTWQYYGEEFKTWALATDGDGGIIYDNVATFVPSPNQSEDIEWKQYLSNSPKELSNSRIVEMGQEYIIISIFHIGDHHPSQNILGRYYWEYEIKCISKFSGQSGLFLGVEEMWARATYEQMWSCSADIGTVYGVPGGSSSHVFKWAYTYGESPVSVEIMGNGVTFNGAGVQMQGQENHTPDTCINVGDL